MGTQRRQGGFGGELVDSPGAVQPPEQQSFSQMSDLDKFGLAGLLGMIRRDQESQKREYSNVTSLAFGQDLTTLGLDLNQPG